jgi:GT2 family glycosyltransferase
MKKVGVLVVTFNRLILLKEAIDSLRLQTFKDMQIVVVNNGSTDRTKEWLDVQEDIHTITQENLGGAGGFFTGMKYIAEAGYEYCWLMDDDVECMPTALEELMKAIQTDENIGFVCSKIIGIEGFATSVQGLDSRPDKNGYVDCLDKISYQMLKVRTAPFVSVLLSTNIIYKYGLPLKEFFIWGDDTEYTIRISNHQESYIACKSIVKHKRKIQHVDLPNSFKIESDNNRIKNFFYLFRNGAWLLKSESFDRRLKNYLALVKISLKLVSKMQLKKAIIPLKALFASFRFSPKIEYPNNRL